MALLNSILPSALKWLFGAITTLVLLWLSGLSSLVYSNEQRLDNVEKQGAVIIERLDNIRAIAEDTREKVARHDAFARSHR